jgi:hypothetical protein
MTNQPNGTVTTSAVLQRFSEGAQANAADIAKRVGGACSVGLATLAVQSDVLTRYRRMLGSVSPNDAARSVLAVEDALGEEGSGSEELRYGAYRFVTDRWGRR